MPRLAHAPVAGDIAADPRSIRSLGVLSPSRGPGERWISCANSENRSELARWAVLGPEVSIQTSHANQKDRPLCPTCLHLTPVAGAVAGHVCPTPLQRLLPRGIEGRGERPDRTGLLASLESSFPLGLCRLPAGRSGTCRGWLALPWLVISPLITLDQGWGGTFAIPRAGAALDFMREQREQVRTCSLGCSGSRGLHSDQSCLPRR